MGKVLPIVTNAKEARGVIGNNDPVDADTRLGALSIIEDVRKRGEVGLRAQAFRLKDITSEDAQIVFSKEDMKKAFDSLPKDEQELLQRTAHQIRTFAQAQRNSVSDISVPVAGGYAGHNIAPMKSAGCYAPGGNYPLPSSVLMTAVTARVAGVQNVIVASPRPKPVTIAAAHVADADVFLSVGGAQAVAALAYGCGIEGIGADGVDIIVGPGNKWVTAAKQIVSGKCAIDMLAGPSECLVLADDTADPSVIAADLIAQAEHALDALPILVTTSMDIAKRTQEELEKQLSTLSTANTARVACEGGQAIVLPTLAECIELTNAIGPEHLEVMTSNSWEDSKKLTSYGGLFIGSKAAEVFGDYGVGPNHVLPTTGTARYTGGLSVFTFLRIRTWLHMETTTEDQQRMARDAAQLARLEGLEGHARAAEKRLDSEKNSSPIKKQRI